MFWWLTSKKSVPDIDVMREGRLWSHYGCSEKGKDNTLCERIPSEALCNIL
jgi:hypothetical protein